jgi:putative hydrolase of the HAD superfamily
MIDTLIFDLGNVLFPFSWSTAQSAFSKCTGIDFDTIARKMKSADYAILFHEFGTGLIGSERFIAELNEEFGSNMSFDEAASIWCSIFTPDAAMLTMFRKLCTHYRTFILSDTDPLHWSFIDERWFLEEAATGVILSHRFGQMKADRGAFEKIIREYRFIPDKTIFIDDLQKNIDAASDAGINSILHKSYKETRSSLQKYGVTIHE